ncbi:MAG: hypothetical protein ACE5IQ_02770 [Candidatus Methylomirabilales bacterium]
MYEGLAIGFPLIFAIFLPKPLRRSGEQYSSSIHASRFATVTAQDLTKKEEFIYGISYLCLAFASAVPIGWVQASLFQLIQDDGAIFAHRLSDLTVYTAIPGLFLGLLAGAVLHYYAARTYFGDRFDQYLSKKQQGIPLRSQYRWLPVIGISIGFGLSLLNYSVYNCFLIVDRDHIHYSHWTSFASEDRPLADLDSVTLYMRRRAPNGRIVTKRHLELHFRNGDELDTYYLIGPTHIDPLISALSQARGKPIPVEQRQGPK